MEQLQAIMGEISNMGRTFEPMTEEAWEKFKAEDWNRTPGVLNLKDGYDCHLCLNRGDFCEAVQDGRGHWWPHHTPCKCMGIRANIRRMQRSGLGDIIREKTFERYEVTRDWQRTMKERAQAFAKNPMGWFFIGGQSGCGKSHLCTAICRKFLLDGLEVVYSVWPEDIVELQGYEKKDPEKRLDMIKRLKNAEVLYLDDLFKPYEKNGVKVQPSGWDCRVTFEIINARAGKPDLVTIISSEWTQDGLLDIDEATGGRIFELAGENAVSISKDRAKNYRLRGVTKL